MSALLALYRAATAIAAPFAPALLRRRARAGKEDPSRIGERLGQASAPRPEGRLVWLHGASLGETLSILPLVAALRARRRGLAILVTSGTVTAAQLVAKRAPDGVIHQYAPVDTPAAVRRFLDHWRPDLMVLVESELWPNLIVEARRRRVGLALLSARMSAASLAGWGKASGAARALLAPFALVMAQDDAAAEGLVRLGARDDGRLNLKLAGGPPPADAANLARIRDAAGVRPILLAASTHPGEEEVVLDAFTPLADRPDAPFLVIAPRHPARGSQVAALAATRRFSVTRDGAGQAFDGHASVHVADTLGELGLWFRLARAAFMGGSLVPGPEGHNPLEPARLGTPIVCGPHVANWAQVYTALAGGFIPAASAAEIAAAFALILDDPAAARAMSERAEGLATRDDGRLDVAVDRLLAAIP